MNEEKRIELTISTDYVQHWGVNEALRELFQNAIDAGDYMSKYDDHDNELMIMNTGIDLSIDTLLLGNSSKRDDEDSIGQFGEGYKLAMLVLTRAGLDVEVRTGNQVWNTSIEKSDVFDQDVLVVKVKKSLAFQDYCAFYVDGLTPAMYDEYKQYNLHLHMYRSVVTKYGEILTSEEHKGMVFVNGLFVTMLPEDLTHTFGYSIKSKYLELTRDRAVPDRFELLWHISQMVRESLEEHQEIWKDVFDTLLSDGSTLPDIMYLTGNKAFSSNSYFLDALWERFEEENDGKFPVSGMSDDVFDGYHIPVESAVSIDSSLLLNMIKRSNKYHDMLNSFEYKEPEPSLSEMLEEAKEQYDVGKAVDFDKMIVKAVELGV